ncbi:MAG: hypothetical protein GT601_17575 [Acidaminobacter sp.]|uniref:WD40 repeat domain-containing protein n=1 Tax=Acidaminobacter sp. TaxID=1872102 RepID=UPI00138422A2|nr:WD40 repeat domain-containing protein [Acidaminobacter sp.]MZQ99480.1 hypothetical protein [Acidaminobacter sp.]
MARGPIESAGGAKIYSTEESYELAESVVKDAPVGTKVASLPTTKITATFDVAVPSAAYRAEFNEPKGLLSVGINAAPYLHIYTVDGTSFTKQADPAVAFLSRIHKWSPNGEYLAVGGGASCINIYKFVDGVLTKLADPAVLPTASPTAIAWSGDSKYLMVTTNTSPFMVVYERSGDTFSNLANPADTNSSASCTVDPTGTYFVLGQNSASSYFRVYKREGTTLTKIYETTSTYAFLWIEFSPSGRHIAVAYDAPGGGIRMFKRVGDVFSNMSLSLSHGEMVRSMRFSPDNNIVAYAPSDMSRLYLSKRDGDVFGTAVNALLSTSAYAQGFAIRADLSMIVAASAESPYVHVLTGGSVKLYNAPEISGFRKIGVAKEDGSIGEVKKMIVLADDY